MGIHQRELYDASPGEYVNSEVIEKKRLELVRMVTDKCRECTFEDIKNRFKTIATRVHFPNKQFFIVINTTREPLKFKCRRIE